MNQETMILEIQLLSYWHAGSGFGRGADVDALVLKEGNSLPYLPGRTVKGLLREAMQCCEEAGAVPEGTTSNLFGTPSKEGDYVNGSHLPKVPRPGRLFTTLLPPRASIQRAGLPMTGPSGLSNCAFPSPWKLRSEEFLKALKLKVI